MGLKKMSPVVGLCLATSMVVSCGKSGGGNDNLPDDFGSMSDAGKVAYMMRTCAPDSVARFIINSSLGLNDGVRIDTFPNAVLYAYETYRDDSLTVFSEEFDSYSSNLPLDRKMKIYSLSSKTDPMGMGYQLGLEYVAKLREKQMTLSQVDAEIEAFRKACVNDSDTYRRFLKGFGTALKVDNAPGLASDIKLKYAD